MRYFLLLLGPILAGTAHAAERHEKPVVGPVPSWVHPVSPPVADPASSDAAVQVLLQDEQFNLQPGVQQRYTESTFKLQTAQGLAAGHVGLSWEPDTQAVTIHKLHVLRANQVIDVLATGQTFTVMRREQNLENASLDGVLTAALQPEGLQVGDIVDFAATVITSDPALGRHAEAAGAAWGAYPVGRAHLRAQWPSDLAMQVKASGDLGPMKPARQGDLSVLDISRDKLKPLPPPAGAPGRYIITRLVEMSDAASWAKIAELIAPVYAKAAVIAPGSPLASEVARIKTASSDPVTRAEAALTLVQDRVRYVFYGMNDGGLLPADAEATWSRRFGDCKGKTVLLLAVLHALGVEAEPVLVSTTLGDALGDRLPTLGAFDHVLVRASVAGKPYWLDGTRLGDRRLAGIAVPAFHWGLPLAAGTKALVPIMPAPLDRPELDIALRIDASKGIVAPAPVHAQRVVRGDDAVTTNLQIVNLSAGTREQALRDFWRQRYDFITVKNATASFDADRRELTLAMDGEAKMDWSTGWYETDGVGVGYKADFSRDPASDQNAPYAVRFPSYTRTVETIVLPAGERFTVYPANADVDETVAGISYHRHAAIAGNVFTVEETDRAVAPEFPAAQAAKAQESLRALNKRTVYLRIPEHYVATGGDAAAAINQTPADAAGLVTRGNMLLDRDEFAKAIVDFDRALALEPKNATALADRGLAYLGKDDVAAATRDLDAASAIEPSNVIVHHGRAMLATRRNDLKAAIASWSSAISIDPLDAFALSERAQAYHQLGHDDAALADAKAALDARPTLSGMSLLRANILRNRGDKAAALAEMKAAVAANPGDDYAQVAAAKMTAALGNRDEAMRMFDAVLKLKPSAYIYLNRGDVRDPSDRAGREADVDQALKLDPAMAPAITAKAALLRERKDWPGVIALLSKAHSASPTDSGLLISRADAYAQSGQATLAAKDLTAARDDAKTPEQLNELCWAKATLKVELVSALADCDAALAGMPSDPAFLDSRGLVLLQLDRFADAVATYSRVLAKEPIAGSFYGRAVAQAKLGNKADAERDRNAALKQDPDVGREFEQYGVTFPKP